MAGVVGFTDGLDRVLRYASERDAEPPPAEAVALAEARGRVLAAAVRADRDQPPFDRVTRDGYAVRASEGAQDRQVRGSLRAGELWHGAPLAPGGAIEIMTGAPLPPGADAVVMVEHTALDGGTLRLEAGREPARGQNFVPRGAELRSGDLALAAGVRLGPGEIAVAASVGAAQPAVYRRPRVAILATGDELVEVEATPAAQQIRNSNSYALAALVAACGGMPEQLPIVRDTHAALREAIATAAAGADLLLLSGGVSAGRYDLVEEVLAEFGAAFFFTGIRMQPGKPLVFGAMPRPGSAVATPSAAASERRLPFFGLPGNPVSTQVTFACMVAPLLRALGGEAVSGPLWLQATLAEAVPARPGLTRVLPAEVRGDPAGTTVRPVPWQGSGDMAANARGNAYVLLPEGSEDFRAGALVRVLLR